MSVKNNERHSSKETDRTSGTISERMMGVHSVQYKGVCKECNSGWMNDLENAVKPILENLIYKEKGYLAQPESMTLSNWLYKTCALYQLTGPDERRKLIKRDDLNYFYRYRQPLGESSVYLCFIRVSLPAKIRMFLPRTRYSLPEELLKDGPLPLQPCFIVYLQIGDLLLSYTYRSPSERWAVLRENDMPARQQIWPCSTPISWTTEDSASISIDPESYFVEFIWQ
jgi:hypothetical protein